MIQSMLSGHSGALTTVHANSPLDPLTRLETLGQKVVSRLLTSGVEGGINRGGSG